MKLKVKRPKLKLKTWKKMFWPKITDILSLLAAISPNVSDLLILFFFWRLHRRWKRKTIQMKITYFDQCNFISCWPDIPKNLVFWCFKIPKNQMISCRPNIAKIHMKSCWPNIVKNHGFRCLRSPKTMWYHAGLILLYYIIGPEKGKEHPMIGKKEKSIAHSALSDFSSVVDETKRSCTVIKQRWFHDKGTFVMRQMYYPKHRF